MTDFRILGASASGPNNSEGYSGQYCTLGLEFYVNQAVYTKFAHLWKNNSSLPTAGPPFQLWQVTGKQAGTKIKGGAGTIGGGNTGGWKTGQMNPILLQPGIRYMLTVDVLGLFAYSDYVFDYQYQSSYWGGSQKVSGTGQYVNGVGNSVIYAPGKSGALNGFQGAIFRQGQGFPNDDSASTNWWIDITVTDQGFPTPLVLGAQATVGKKTSGRATISLGASATSVKRAIAPATAYLNLRASGRSFASDSLVGVAKMALGASGKVTRAASIPGVAPLGLGASSTVHKTVAVEATADLVLDAPVPSDFWRAVADGVRDALLASNWNAERHHFQEAAQVDAEALPADVLGGLFALSIGDHERAHDTIRHLRSFRVKGQQIAGGHYRNSCTMIGYKPYGALGAQAHPAPPQVIDQATTWMAEIFKGNYGEPIGDDVRSLVNWHYTSITAGPSALYGGQFLGVNRTIWNSNYKIVSRPTLAAAAWGYLAATGSTLLFPVHPLPRPQITALALETSPSTPGRHRLDFTWSVDDAVPAPVYQNRLEYRTDRYGPWHQVFEHLAEHQSDLVGADGDYAHVITVPQPSVTTQYRVWVRMRNALYGEWACSNVVQVYSPNSAVFPSPSTYPGPTLFPEG